jgi:hypothetical protein
VLQHDYVPIVVVPDIPVTRDWDLSLQFIVPLIDGMQSVAQIAKAGSMVCALLTHTHTHVQLIIDRVYVEQDIEIVKNALHHLVYYGLIRIIPPFRVCLTSSRPLIVARWWC